jgi:hypothetical protein
VGVVVHESVSPSVRSLAPQGALGVRLMLKRLSGALRYSPNFYD